MLCRFTDGQPVTGLFLMQCISATFVSQHNRVFSELETTCTLGRTS